MTTEYKAAIEALFKRRSTHAPKHRFELLQAFYEKLGRPDLKYPSIHIAGTNGKGSVATKIAKSLELSGFRVGLYISPHIHCFRERISINGKCISEEAVLSGLADMKYDGHFFDIVTLLALSYFADENVEIAVIETGLGGGIDATNIIEPILTVITTLSLDHTQILGDSLDQIAAAKAGIIKPYVPLILGSAANHPIVIEEAAKKSAEVITCKKKL